MNGADLVWSSASDRVVVPAELPVLRQALLLRVRHRLKSHVGIQATNSAVWLFIAFSAMHRSAAFAVQWQPFLFIAVALGLLPLGSTLLELWRHRSVEAIDWDARIRYDRFLAWMAQRRRWTSLVLTTALVLVFVVQFAAVARGDSEFERSFLAAGSRRDLVLGGEPWRLLTAGLLHGSPLHLFFNAVALLALGRQVEAIGGKARLLAVFTFSIVGGYLASIAWQSDRIAVGASGGLFGLMGWLLAVGWRARRSFPPQMWRSIAFIVLLNGVLGWMARDFIDNAAHAGGFAIGVLAGFLTRLDDARVPAPPGSIVRASGWLAALALAAASVSTTVILLRGS